MLKMHIIDPRRLQHASMLRQRHKRTKKLLLVFSMLFFLASGYAGYCLKRPLPTLAPVRTAQISVPSKDVALAWPGDGQTAIGALNYGVLAQSGAETPKPIASVAKVMTALAVLKKYPLEPGQKGPTIAVTAADIKSYNDYVAKDGSVVAVNLGEQLTQYQALQGLLIPSGNNIADLLVRWAFGSMDVYLTYANNMAKELGMDQTKISDASGFSAQTVSTPSDLVRLGLAALDDPIIAEVVKQTSADLPVAGTIRSTNIFLGKSDVIGIKTGHTDEAGGCFLLGATHDFGGQKTTVVVATVGAKDINAAMGGSVNMLPSITAGFGSQTVVKTGDLIGYYNVPWKGQVNITSDSEMTVFGWLGKTIEPKVDLNKLSVPSALGSAAGSITLQANGSTAGSVTVIDQAILTPTKWWRLTHPL